MTAPQLARQAALSTSAVYKIMAGGSSMPQKATLEKIGRALRIPPAELHDAAAEDTRPENATKERDGEWASWLSDLIMLSEDVPPSGRESLRRTLTATAEAIVEHVEWNNLTE